MTTHLREVQSAKARASMKVTELGMVMEGREVQEKKALS
jgi:hypothetical protein